MTEELKYNDVDGEDMVYALIQLNALRVRLDIHELEQHAMTIAVPRTAQERHIKEYGHRLKLGCCAKRVLKVAEKGVH